MAPVFLRLRNPDFEPGPWNLGRWSAPVGWTAIVWVGIICVLFVLPTAGPITATNFNYTIVAVVVVVGGAWLWWVAQRPQVVHRPEAEHRGCTLRSSSRHRIAFSGSIDGGLRPRIERGHRPPRPTTTGGRFTVDKPDVYKRQLARI